MSNSVNDSPEHDGGTKVVRLVPSTTNVPTNLDPYRSLGGYGMPGEEQGGLGIDIFEYLRVVNKRKWLILSIVAACVALGGIRTLMQTPMFTSVVRLQIDNVTKVLDSGNLIQAEGLQDFDFLQTQYELLQGRAIAERVASALKLGSDDSFFDRRGFSIGGLVKSVLGRTEEPKSPREPRSDSAAAGLLMANMAVQPIKGSRLVDIIYSDPEPARAQRIANAYADAFIASNLDKRFEANAYAKTFLEDQIKQLKLRLEESEKVMLDFAQKEQIVDVNEKGSIAESNLAAANATLGSLVSERIKNEQLWRQVENATEINLPQLLTNNVIDGLRAKRNALVTEYQEKLETFKPSYPAMVQINNKIKEVNRQLASEVETIKGSLKAAYESSLNQERETKEQIEKLRGNVIDLQKRSIQYNILKREVDTNRGLYNGLLQRYKEIDVAGGVGANNIFVVDKAQLPGDPSSPNLSRALVLALMFGLGAGLGAAFLLEYIDDTIHSVEEMERISGLPSLGVVPKLKDNEDVVDALLDPRSALSEAYRSLCTALQFSTDHGLPKTLLVTSSGPGEGKSISSIAIARHFAMMGMKVLIVDADLRNPSLHKKFGVDNAIGLSNYLTGGCTPPEAFQMLSIENLAFMPSGPLPPNAADLLGSSRLHSLLSIGLEVFDLIVLDGPPVMGLADAMLLSNATSATLFIVAANQARTSQVRGSLRRLHLGRTPSIVGAALLKYDAKAAGYGYGYGYGYGDQAYTYGTRLEHQTDQKDLPGPTRARS
ncbi:MAG: polysaccharide biosynthesis tyrosine autokinase [Hyphomicrobiaceae bacterium]|nr:polysaccharide biosynthesis tyrosine autokinase [Hyphomicrobiaceae bacterium]